MKSLGKTLKEVRELVPFTLRQVEEATGISNAYLSQLENDKIKKPSANVLYKLSAIYNVPLNVLLGAAGIIEKTASSANHRNSSEWLNNIAFYADNLTDEQQNEVLEYIRFMKFKSKNGWTIHAERHW